MTQTETIVRLFGTSEALAAACRRFRVQRLYLFGSAATGHGFDPSRSDIDLLVTFQPFGPAGYADAWFGLREALEALSGRPIGLITDAAIKNPFLRRRVDNERQLLFEAPGRPQYPMRWFFSGMSVTLPRGSLASPLAERLTTTSLTR